MEESQNRRFIEITKYTSLQVNGVDDERHVIAGKIYEVIDVSEEGYHVTFGKVKGIVPKHCGRSVALEKSPKLTVAWLYGNNGEFLLPYNGMDSHQLGLDVISPTWFKREGDCAHPESIQVVSTGNREFVQAAHQKGYEVWGLIADFDANRNYAVYTNDQLVEQEINKIVNFALELNLDGINIDFEGFGSRCREAYSRYVEKLAMKLKENDLIVSIDVTKESNSDAWGKCYDRKEIARFVDYVAFMAYDENGRLDTLPGSTGSMPWVEDGIQKLLDMDIEKERILLGVPFYTRDWQVKEVSVDRTSVLVTAWEDIALFDKPSLESNRYDLTAKEVLDFISEENGWYGVSKNGGTYFMPSEKGKILLQGVRLFVSEKVDPLFSKDIKVLQNRAGAVTFQDEMAGQEKLIYQDDWDQRHEVWVENVDSMEKRMELINQYDLAGMAAWALNQEDPKMWEAIKKKLKAVH